MHHQLLAPSTSPAGRRTFACDTLYLAVLYLDSYEWFSSKCLWGDSVANAVTRGSQFTCNRPLCSLIGLSRRPPPTFMQHADHTQNSILLKAKNQSERAERYTSSAFLDTAMLQYHHLHTTARARDVNTGCKPTFATNTYFSKKLSTGIMGLKDQ